MKKYYKSDVSYYYRLKIQEYSTDSVVSMINSACLSGIGKYSFNEKLYC